MYPACRPRLTKKRTAVERRRPTKTRLIRSVQILNPSEQNTHRRFFYHKKQMPPNCYSFILIPSNYLLDNLNFVFFRQTERKLHKIQIFGSDLEISIFLHIVNIHSFGRIVQNVNKVIFWSINRRLNLLTKICPLSAEPFQINIFSKKIKILDFFSQIFGSIDQWMACLSAWLLWSSSPNSFSSFW